MTVIAAKIENRYITIGCDTMLTAGDLFCGHIDTKLVKFGSGCVLGWSGNLTCGSLFEAYDNRMQVKSYIDLIGYMSAFSKHLDALNLGDVKDEFGGIIATPFGLFELEGVVPIPCYSDISTSGCGYAEAIGALHAGAGVQESIGAAIKANLFCGGNILVEKIKIKKSSK